MVIIKECASHTNNVPYLAVCCLPDNNDDDFSTAPAPSFVSIYFYMCVKCMEEGRESVEGAPSPLMLRAA